MKSFCLGVIVGSVFLILVAVAEIRETTLKILERLDKITVDQKSEVIHGTK